ncbi:MAG: alpha/beta hydrolase [Rhodobacteraceae bacterium]|nr:alpha/beta hydrolase [Paracoccaceae bacterium]
MDYVFSVRSVKDGVFSDEPGATYFLKVPASAKAPDPKHVVDRTVWFEEVQKLARHGPQDDGPAGDIVFYVHGYNTPQKTMLERQRLLRQGLEKAGFEGVVVSFDWPSKDSALNYLEDRVDAKQTAFRLVSEGIAAFAAIQRPDCRINVHVFAHSTGGYVVREAFDDADDRPAVAARSWSVSQVILISADISAGSMARDSSKSSSLYRHCVRLTNYSNPFDDVLSLSNVKRVGVAPRVGRIGLPDDAPDKAVNVFCGNRFKQHRAKFEHLRAPAHIWYFYDDRLLEDVALTVKGDIDRNEIPTRVRAVDGRLVLDP